MSILVVSCLETNFKETRIDDLFKVYFSLCGCGYENFRISLEILLIAWETEYS